MILVFVAAARGEFPVGYVVKPLLVQSFLLFTALSWTPLQREIRCPEILFIYYTTKPLKEKGFGNYNVNQISQKIPRIENKL